MRKLEFCCLTMLFGIAVSLGLKNNNQFISVDAVQKNAMCSVDTRLINYDIIYETNGGNDIPNGKACTGETCALVNYASKIPTPVKEGYTFAGWYYDEAFTKKVSATTVNGIAESQNGKIVSCGTDKMSIKIYAKWVENIQSIVCPEPIEGGAFNISYETNGGNSIADVKVVVGAEPTQFGELPVPTKDGYTFAGWYYDAKLTKAVNAKYNASVSVMENYEQDGCEYSKYSDVTLYAKWVSKPDVSCSKMPVEGGAINVNYEPNNGSKLESSKLCTGCAPTGEKLPVPTKEGYVFAGWYYDTNFTKMVNGDKVRNVDYMVTKFDENGCDLSAAADVTLYAKWVPQLSISLVCPEPVDGGGFNLNFESNGGSKIEQLSVCIGCDPTLTKLPVPTKDGYTFAGWYYDINLTEQVNAKYAIDVDHVEISEENGCIIYKNINRTLYAKWQKVYKEKDIELILDEKMTSNIKSVEIKKLSKEDKSMTVLNKNITKFNAYEIDLLDANNSKVQPNGNVILKLPIAEDININNLVVYRVDGDKLVTYDPIIVDGYAQIETDHFSIYAVGEKKSVSNPETGDNILIYVSFGILLVVGSVIITKKLKYSK